MSRLVRLVAVSLALVAVAPMAPASAVDMRKDLQLPVLHLSGDIVAGDDAKLAQVLSAAGSEIRTIALNSYGGNVMIAVAMGRLINRLGLGTVVMPGSQCNSACFFVWVAGAPRINQFGIIGLHRPYAEYYGTGTQQGFDTLAAQLYAEIEAYLVVMGVPRPIIETMQETPPGQLHVLTDQELRTFPVFGARLN